MGIGSELTTSGGLWPTRLIGVLIQRRRSDENPAQRI